MSDVTIAPKALFDLVLDSVSLDRQNLDEPFPCALGVSGLNDSAPTRHCILGHIYEVFAKANPGELSYTENWPVEWSPEWRRCWVPSLKTGEGGGLGVMCLFAPVQVWSGVYNSGELRLYNDNTNRTGGSCLLVLQRFATSLKLKRSVKQIRAAIEKRRAKAAKAVAP